MKIKLLMAVALSSLIILASCKGSDARLAGELVGTWKGNTTEVSKGKKGKPDKGDRDKTDKGDKYKESDREKADRARTPKGDDGEMTCTPTLTFVRSTGTNGGDLKISATYTVSRGVTSVTSTLPVKATVSGNVSVSGFWNVKDGDEVVLNIDPSKIVVDVDTASLSLSYARLTDAPRDSLNTIKERVAANVSDVIKPMLTGKIQKLRKFDDVKINGNTMTLEAGPNKMTFTKQ